jgi:hypothetical protein
MKILFLHGWHSVVGGVKPTFLKDAGNEVINPALDHDDFATALQVAQAVFNAQRPDVVVGSSRGGAIAMNIDSGTTPLVLLCPAWKNWGTVRAVKPNSIILHSRADEVIPFAASEELVLNSGLNSSALIEIGQDHRLADEASLSVMLWACQLLAVGEQVPADEPSDAFSATVSVEQDPSLRQEASYICDACSEEIVIPLDLTEGATQVYVEDCPVCCRANLIKVEIDAQGAIQVWAEPEQDHD